MKRQITEDSDGGSIIGNLDTTLQKTKLTIAMNESLNRERAKELTRNECQNICSVFNLFRGRSKFIYLLLNEIIVKFADQLKADMSTFEKGSHLVNRVIDLLVTRVNSAPKVGSSN